MRTLKRPMFRMGGGAFKSDGTLDVNQGIMTGLVTRNDMAKGGNADGITSNLVNRKQLQAGTALKNVNTSFDSFYQDPNMDQLRAFQSLGMGNPFRNTRNMAGRFKNAFTFKEPARGDDIIKKMVESAPIVQKRKNIEASTEAAKAASEKLEPFKQYFSSMTGADYVKPPAPAPEKKNDDALNNLDDDPITQEERNRSLEERAKEFEELLNPGARKRVITNALAAASASFGKSTGNTMQDIANAISAAAGATGEIDKDKRLATKLAIEEDIKKNIAEASKKDRAKGNYEIIQELALKGKDRTPDEEIMFKALTAKAKEDEKPEDRFLKIEADLGRPRAVQDKYRNDETFAGVINTKKEVKGLSKDSVGKVVYLSQDNGLYEVVVNAKGKLDLKFLKKEKGD